MKRVYQNQNVFAGIDVHFRFYHVTCLCEGVIVKRFRCKACPEGLAESLKRFFEGAQIHSVYETGFSGFGLHRVLVAQGVKNIVVHAGDVEVSTRRNKSDKRDSRKLAEQLAAGRLKGIYVPNEEEELKRQLTRTRRQLVEHRTRIKNQIRMRFHYFGLIPSDLRQEMSVKLVEKLLEGVEQIEIRLSVESLLSIWLSLDTEIRDIEAELKKQARQDKNEAIWRQLPGIGRISSRELSNELGDLRRFPNQKAIFRYTGLTPAEYSSGEERRLGHISREGKSILRHVLVEAAWTAIRKDKKLKEFFEQLKLRAGAKRAIVAVARKLIGIARALFVQGTEYKYQAV